MTTEDMLCRVSQPDFDPAKEAFFQGNSEGPCRFGMYSMLQRRILDKLGHMDVDIVTLGSKSEHGGLGTMFALVVWDCDSHPRPALQDDAARAALRGQQGRYRGALREVCEEAREMIPAHKKRIESGKLAVMTNTRHLDEFEELLRRAQEDFARIPVRKEDRPLVGMVGEFYVRLHDGANQDILRKLEAEGAETWLAPMTEFFAYANFIGKILSRDRIKDGGLTMDELKEYIGRWFNARLASKDEHALFHAALPFLGGYEDIGPAEVIDKGSKYVDYNFGGEAIC